MNEIAKFCEIVRKRSAEHAAAMMRVEDLPAIMASILRQELDSLIRTFYLLSNDNIEDRNELASQLLKGEKWTSVTAKGKNKAVTDKDMLNLLNKLFGWSGLVYKFGCAFIHFSNFHDYSENNPFENIGDDEKRDILVYLREYHGGPKTDSPTFNELASYFPKVFTKISENLEYYLKVIEANEISNDI